MKAHIRSLRLPQDVQRYGPAPPGATNFFIGDNTGGSGWVVKLPDGTVEKYYAEMPGDIGKVEVHFPEAPTSHLGDEVPDTTIDTLAGLYYNYIQQLVADARNRFIGEA